MKKLDERVHRDLTLMVREYKDSLAEKESLFLEQEQINQRINTLLIEISLQKHYKRTDSSIRSKRESADRIDMLRSLLEHQKECMRLKEKRPKEHKREQISAYSEAQVLNFSLFTLNRAIERINERVDDRRFIIDMCLRYLESPRAIHDAAFQVRYMNNHLGYEDEINPEVLCEETHERLSEEY